VFVNEYCKFKKKENSHTTVEEAIDITLPIVFSPKISKEGSRQGPK
jgi:hypothetical protein